MIKGSYQEIEFELDLAKSLNKLVDAIGYDKNKVSKALYKPDFSREDALLRVSPETLLEIEKLGDRQVATEDCNVLKFNNVQFDSVNKIVGTAVKNLGVKSFGLSGRTWYPENGYMGWHTNSNSKGFRLYCSFVREAGKSFFRHKDPVSKEIITSWDKANWNFRVFKIDDALLWHSVYSETDRFSIGYTLHI